MLCIAFDQVNLIKGDTLYAAVQCPVWDDHADILAGQALRLEFAHLGCWNVCKPGMSKDRGGLARC